MNRFRRDRTFSNMDHLNSDHLIRIRDGDEWKMAFNTLSGHFQYLVMPFSLPNAPAVFRPVSMMSWRTLSNDLPMYTVITFWFSLSPSRNMLFTSWKDYWRTRCLSRQGAANYTLIMFFSWAGSLLCVYGAREDPSSVGVAPKRRPRKNCISWFANFYSRLIHNYSKILTSHETHLK